jgi:hypothetical protein
MFSNPSTRTKRSPSGVIGSKKPIHPNDAHDIEGTPAEEYLKRRGIFLSDFSFSLSRPLHYHWSVGHSRPGGAWLSFPALGATIHGHDFADGLVPIPIGQAFTYLELDGRKLDRPGLKSRLFAAGSRVAGGGVWFGELQPDEPCVIGEGIETTLSAMIIFGAGAGIATLAANFLPAVRLPDPVQTIIIAADHDGPKSDNIGYRKACYAAARWRAEGRKVTLMRPHDPGVDFNDILKRRRGVAP